MVCGHSYSHGIILTALYKEYVILSMPDQAIPVVYLPTTHRNLNHRKLKLPPPVAVNVTNQLETMAAFPAEGKSGKQKIKKRRKRLFNARWHYHPRKEPSVTSGLNFCESNRPLLRIIWARERFDGTKKFENRMKNFSSEMAANSKSFRPSLTRCKTPSRRRGSSPRSYKSKGKRFRNSSSPTLRFTSERYRVRRPRTGEQHVDKGLHRRREHSRKPRAEPSTGRLSVYNGYSESKYSDDAPKNRDFLFEKEKMEWDRNDSRQIRGLHHSKTYENRGDARESTRRSSRISRERSRSGDGIRHESYDDRESHRSVARLPEIHDEAESRYPRPQAVRRPPLAVALPRPTRILLPPRLVRHPPHVRLPFTTRVIPATVRPVLLAPVVILRAPMMPFRPQIQPVGLCN